MAKMRGRTARGEWAVAGALLAMLYGGFAWGQAADQHDPHAGHTMPAATTPAEHSHESVTAIATADGQMDMSAMQRGAAPPDARDPHAYAEGQKFGPMKLELADTHNFGGLTLENLEAARVGGDTLVLYDLQAWYGHTYDRAVVKSEGHIERGEITEARTEVLWGHAFATFWDRQLGARYDSGSGPNRSWLAFGVQGLSPYKFELEGTAYLGEAGRSALRFDASRELLLTQKLILQPRVEANLYGKSDAERGLGSGLADVTAALRLRYEIRRELAPYVGIEWVRSYGETRDIARAAGQNPNDARLVVGLRFWF